MLIILPLNIILEICNFWLKTYLTEMALAPSFVYTYLTLGWLKVVPYYWFLLNICHHKSADFGEGANGKTWSLTNQNFTHNVKTP